MGWSDLHVHQATRMAEGLLGLAFNGRRDLWTRARLRGRTKDCWRCGGTMAPGDLAFRPMGDHDHRMRRLCLDCVEELAPMTEPEVV